MDNTDKKPENFENLTPPPDFSKKKISYGRELSKKPVQKKKILLYFFIILALVFTTNCGIRYFSLSQLPDDPNVYDENTLQPKKIGFFTRVKNFLFKSNNILEGERDERINILLLGMGGAGHDGPFLTDTNIILSINPSTGEVAMVSVPRDLGANIPGYGWYKINHANAYGEVAEQGKGGEFARQVFEQTFNLDIPYYLRVDFKAFTEIVDIVNEISVDVKRPFVDFMYPDENYGYQTVVFQEGVQSLSGERALEYVRSRHGNNGQASDFARAHRQQQVLSALKEKVFSLSTYTNPLKIKEIMDSLSTHITTNLTFGQMMYLASLAKGVDTASVKTLVLDDSEEGYLYATISNSGAFILSPKTGNFDEINNLIGNVFQENLPNINDDIATYNDSIFPSANIEILNGTWQVGLAGRMEQNLEEQGFSVSSIGNAYKRPVASTTVYLINSSTPTGMATLIAEQLETTFVTDTPDWLSVDFDDEETLEDESGKDKYGINTDILIILGEDANI